MQPAKKPETKHRGGERKREKKKRVDSGWKKKKENGVVYQVDSLRGSHFNLCQKKAKKKAKKKQKRLIRRAAPPWITKNFAKKNVLGCYGFIHFSFFFKFSFFLVLLLRQIFPIIFFFFVRCLRRGSPFIL